VVRVRRKGESEPNAKKRGKEFGGKGGQRFSRKDKSDVEKQLGRCLNSRGEREGSGKSTYAS